MGDLPPESHRLTPDTLPTPFSADQIRDACRPGRSNSFLVEKPGFDAYVSRWEFVTGDDAGADSVRWTETLDGEALGPREESHGTWGEFQHHAAYPADRTVISAESIDVPAGRYACWCYTTTDPGHEVTRAWFARDLPGPPIRVVTEVDGTTVFSSTLIAVVDPRT